MYSVSCNLHEAQHNITTPLNILSTAVSLAGTHLYLIPTAIFYPASANDS